VSGEGDDNNDNNADYDDDTNSDVLGDLVVPRVHAMTGPMIGLTSMLETITTALSACTRTQKSFIGKR
jgi:hypothetical protein